MNRDHYKKLLPIIQAFTEGKTIQIYMNKQQQWKDLDNLAFNAAPTQYRIKPETVKIEYRRYLYTIGSKSKLIIGIVNKGDIHRRIETWSEFVRWIDPDWITEEVEI